MSLTVPLAVRIYDIVRGLDQMVTKWVEDFTFRHTAPGGCASCTIKLHIPKDLPIDPQEWGRLFTRVQIIDKRDAEVIWEGRVEDPVQRSDEDVWELGVLGAAVVATDVTIPFIYVDNTLEHWKPVEADAYDHNKEDINKTLTTRLQPSYVFNAGTQFDIWTWTGGSANGVSLARVTCTYNGTGPNTTQDDFFDQILNGGIYGNLDVTSFNVAGDSTKVNLLPNDAQFPDGLINQIYFSIRRNSTNYTVANGDQIIARFKNPKIQAIRVGRNGSPLLTAADYSHGDFVYVRHVIEDVIGRWLVGNWDQGPYLSNGVLNSGEGSVSPRNAYVDISDTTKITNLQFTSGATARDVLESMMGIQTEAYWAIWASDYVSGYQVQSSTYDTSRFRFEWATWPESWNYIVSAKDGMEQQLSAEDCFSDIYVRNTFESSDEPFLTPSNWTGPYPAPGVTWDISETFQRRFSRVMFTDESSNPMPTGTDNYNLAYTEGAKHSLPKNAGTITIRRPIYCFDSGANSSKSQMGMLEPWELKPGRLIMIQDIMPLVDAGNLSRHRVLVNDNPGFEVNTSGWGSSGGTFVRDTAQKYVGAASGKITPNGTSATVYIATNWQPYREGSYYEFSVWVRCAVARSITVRMDFYDSASAFLSNIPVTKSVSANTWTQFRGSGTAPANTTQGPMIILMDGTPATSNIMWVDEGKITRVGETPASQRNCVFRVAATNYNVADNSCQMELDQLPKWSVPTQIANPGSGSVSTR